MSDTRHHSPWWRPWSKMPRWFRKAGFGVESSKGRPATTMARTRGWISVTPWVKRWTVRMERRRADWAKYEQSANGGEK